MSDIYLSLTETPTVVTLSQPVVSGALASTVTVANTVTVALDANSLSALENVTVTVGAAISGTVTVANFPASQTVQGTVTVGSLPAISGSVTVNNFPSTQTVAGTVTANVFGKDNTGTPQQLKTDATGILSVSASGSVQCVDEEGLILGSDRNFPISGTVTVGNSVTIGSLPAISGTVTANLFGEAVGGGPNEPTKLQCDSNGFLITSLYRSGSDAVNYDPVAGNVSVNVKNVSSVTVSALPSGAMTTRFGSVTTANTAQITSAVTNTSRKYLLAQNISAGTVTIGIGFSPTTTQGIQLASGGGLTFDAFCPTGAVYWLGAVTGANYCLIEG